MYCSVLKHRCFPSNNIYVCMYVCAKEITYHGVRQELDRQRELLAATRGRIGVVHQSDAPAPDQAAVSAEAAADDIDSFISKNQHADAQHVCALVCIVCISMYI